MPQRRGLPPGGLTAAKMAVACERRLKAMELRKAGKGYREIGKALGVSHVQALHDVERVLDELNAQATDTAERYRRLELERLDAMLESQWPAALGGHLRAQEMVLRIMERRAKLLGLDAAQSVRVEWVQEYQRIAAEYGVPVERVYELAGYQPSKN